MPVFRSFLHSIPQPPTHPSTKTSIRPLFLVYILFEKATSTAKNITGLFSWCLQNVSTVIVLQHVANDSQLINRK